jgi:hypothetical protein
VLRLVVYAGWGLEQIAKEWIGVTRIQVYLAPESSCSLELKGCALGLSHPGPEGSYWNILYRCAYWLWRPRLLPLSLAAEAMTAPPVALFIFPFIPALLQFRRSATRSV